MAICRCLGKHAWPKARGKNGSNYVAYVYPIGHLNSALVCPHCLDSAVIWLDEEESIKYENGERIFALKTKTTYVKADDSGIEKRKQS